jgi:hypothetical protein
MHVVLFHATLNCPMYLLQGRSSNKWISSGFQLPRLRLYLVCPRAILYVMEERHILIRVPTEFDVHGSVQLGNICLIKGPTRCTYYVFFIPLYI